MSLQNTIRAYALIVEYVGSRSFTPIPALLNNLEQHDIDISKRTLERYISSLRIDFGIEIVFDRTKNGYVLEQQYSQPSQNLFHLLDRWREASVFSENMENGVSPLHYIDFGQNTRMKGLEWFKPIFFALNNSRKMELWYKKFGEQTAKKHIINPLRLKQYRDRWYLICWNDTHKALRTFAFDRITKLNVKESRITIPKKLDINTLFRYTIGIDYQDNKPTKIRFRCHGTCRHYLESLPIHHTQKIIETNQTQGTTFEIFVVINHELKQLLLSHGKQLEVLHPPQLKEILQSMK